jgi:hypothetical protein
MMNCWNGSKKLIVGLAVIAAFGMVSCKDKKSKKKKNKPKTEEVDDKKALQDEPVYGKEVIEGNTVVFRSSDKIFFIKATPHTAVIGETITFEGKCLEDNSGSILWNFGDRSVTSEKRGFSVTHQYVTFPSDNGSIYVVSATCFDAAGVAIASKSGTLTINIISQTGDRPGQNPNQNAVQQ